MTTCLLPLSARRAASAEELDEAGVAVGLLVLLLEGALVELFEAEGADEVLGVELLVHGGDAAPRDGLHAPRAQRPPLGVVVNLTVRHALVVKETSPAKRHVAVLEETMLYHYIYQGWVYLMHLLSSSYISMPL